MSEEHIRFVKENLRVPIVLVGMMGVGKTSIGQALAHKLGWNFKDSDKIVEDKAGMPVSDIFAVFGEKKFRSAEKTVILDALKEKPHVLSTGGGALMEEETLQAVKNRALSIWLQSDVDSVFERVSKNDNRPLLQTEDPKQTLEELLEKRRVFYEKADLVLDTGQNSIDATTENLIKLMYGFLDRR